MRVPGTLLEMSYYKDIKFRNQECDIENVLSRVLLLLSLRIKRGFMKMLKMIERENFTRIAANLSLAIVSYR
jgi:hypothetical protein